MPIFDEDIGSLSDVVKNGDTLERVLAKMYGSVSGITVEGNVYFKERPVYKIFLETGGEKKTVYAKNDWEGNGKESYGIACHNLVSENRVNFASFNNGRTIFMEEVPGRPLKDHKSLSGSLAQSYGEAVALAEFVGIGDRYADNVLEDGKTVRHIDFGSFFTGGMPMYKWETADTYSEKIGYSNAMRRISRIVNEKTDDFEELLSDLGKISKSSEKAMRENYDFIKAIRPDALEKLLQTAHIVVFGGWQC